MSAQKPLSACVVVPTYNEVENVGPLVDRLKAAGVSGLQLLFVDDSSPDGTGEAVKKLAAENPWIHLLSRPAKKGIGTAYLDGFKEASKLNPDVVVEMDADLQHPPESLPKLLDAVRAGADVALGSRYVPGGKSRGWGLYRRVESRVANFYAKTVLSLPVRDCTSGFRAYKRRAADKLVAAELPASGFEFQVASLFLLKGDSKMTEVPYTFRARKAGKSKLGLKNVAQFFLYTLWLGLG